MQKIYDLINGIASFLKGRYGYALTIGNARIAAYGVFLVGVFTTLYSMLAGIYTYIFNAYSTTLIGQVLYFMPSPSIVSTGFTLWMSVKTYKLAMGYMDKTWKAWLSNNAM